MAIRNFNCGDMSNAVITSDSFSGVIDITVMASLVISI